MIAAVAAKEDIIIQVIVVSCRGIFCYCTLLCRVVIVFVCKRRKQ